MISTTRGQLLTAVVVAALGICARSAAAQSHDPDFFSSVYWSIDAKEAPPPTGTASAAVGSLLFRQSFRSSQIARLTRDASISVPGVTRWTQSPGEVALSHGTALFSVTGVGANTVFCSGQSAYRGTTIWDNRNWRFCLLDRDRNGVFDHILWMPITDVNNFGGMFVLRDGRAEGEVAVPYSLENDPDDVVFSGGPVITRSSLGAYRVTLGLCAGEGVRDTRASSLTEARARHQSEPVDASTVWFFAQDLPITVDLDGALIEITAIEGDQVTYHALTSFDPSRTIALWYNRTLPVECAAS